MYSGFMNHAVPLWVLYVNKRSTNVSHLVNTQNAITGTSEDVFNLLAISVPTRGGGMPGNSDLSTLIFLDISLETHIHLFVLPMQ